MNPSRRRLVECCTFFALGSLLAGAGMVAGCSGDGAGNAGPNGGGDAGTDGSLPPSNDGGGEAGEDADVPLPAPAPLTPEALASSAQRPTGPDVETYDDVDGHVTGVSGRLARLRHAPTADDAALSFAESWGRTAWGWTGAEPHVAILGPERETIPVEKAGPNNLPALRVSQVTVVQVHAGIPIHGRELVVAVGEHSSDPGFVIGGFSGGLRPAPTGAPSPIPTLDLEGALREASKDSRIAGQKLVTVNGIDATYRGLLVWREVAGGGLALSWRVLAQRDPSAGQPDVDLLVDATTGALVSWSSTDQDASFNVGEIGKISAPAQKGTSPRSIDGAFIDAPGVVPIQGWAAVRSMPSGPGYTWIGLGTTPFVAPTATFVGDAAYTGMKYLTDVYEHTATTFDWLDKNLGYKGWDGSGAFDLSVYGLVTPEFNCSASTSRGALNVFSGTNSGAWDNPACTGLSVVAHELGHFFVYANNPLEYRGESGALNEAMADLMDALVRGWSSTHHGDDIDSPSKYTRSFDDPPVRSQPDRYYSPKKVTPEIDADHGGVHANSGIVNKAHFLMARGGTFNGFNVVPLAASVSDAAKAQMRLVDGALMAHSFGEHSTLPQYAAGLLGFCHAQTAMWKGLGLVSSDACASVHDAFAATELIEATNAPTDLEPSVFLVRRGAGLGEIDVVIRVKNRGAARYQGRLRFDLRGADGVTTVSSPLLFPKVTIQGKGQFDTGVQHLSARVVVDDLPHTARLIMTDDLPADATYKGNDVKTIVLDGDLMPDGLRSDTITVTGTVHVSVGAAGNFPFLGKDAEVRILYRKKGEKKLTPGTATATRTGDDLVIPLVGGPGLGVHTEPLRADFAAVTDASFTTSFREISGGSALHRQGYLVLHKDGSIKTSRGDVVDADLVFAAFNPSGKMKVSSDKDYIFCLNCGATNELGEHAEFSALAIAAGVKLEDYLPADLAAVYAPLSLISGIKATKFMQPGFLRWISAGPTGTDPGVIPRPPILVNLGPM